jgi:hypothetical protein
MELLYVLIHMELLDLSNPINAHCLAVTQKLADPFRP